MKTNEFYKALIERSYRAVENRNLDELDELVQKDVIIHTRDMNIPGNKEGIDYLKEQGRFYMDAFPDMRFSIKDIFIEGDKGMAYYTVTGRNTGEINGMPPTNKEVSADVVEMFRFKEGKLSEYWSVFDNLSFMMQLGLITQEDLQKKVMH
ncbi:MAG TPA: ester cyclase [Anditalea sp.]|nr:ester cyclase [Anditalea sp.]